jgi:hypothetical protein
MAWMVLLRIEGDERVAEKVLVPEAYQPGHIPG